MVKSWVSIKKDLCWDLKENILWEIICKNKISLPLVQFLKLGSKNYYLRKKINSFFKNKINVRKKKKQKRTKPPNPKPQEECGFQFLFIST